MYIGVDDGCQAVPDPIAPIGMMFDSLEPTRTPISSPDITSREPLSPLCSVLCAAPGDGVVAGMCMSWPAGSGEGEGVAAGMCMS